MTTRQASSEPGTGLTRNDRRRQRTREAILAAADQVFRRVGVDAATVNDVTEEADVAYGSFYNHFKTMDDVVAALAAETLQRVADRTGEIIQKADRVELLPCVGARFVVRMLSQDPAIRWLLNRPYILVDAFHEVARPFMVNAESQAVQDGRLRPVGGHECWLQTFPWLLISELNALLSDGDVAAHEERFARISLRFLGVDDTLAPTIIEESKSLVNAQTQSGRVAKAHRSEPKAITG
ncbi:TetR/AcrR family transcriptional regulator [Trinickia terrae]|uniref:TetR/AcrR family transcriptional regulator n=1 Tax=Trinickia terrae TaxID=2571161 RepID=A0A4U1H9A2_9BURK|nr:TetR/AcrR family transcriptional regulator [Trinickia terrae]TKC77271.1 TetR/AcrR family transcriptional regulator [Trinickia terrae]